MTAMRGRQREVIPGMGLSGSKAGRLHHMSRALGNVSPFARRQLFRAQRRRALIR